jgi:prepilin peptidase CpaA
MVVFFCAACIVAAIAAWTDARTGRIPNWLTVGALAVGLVAHGAAGWTGSGIRGALLGCTFAAVGALACSIVPLLLVWWGAIGGGDLKLFAAIGAICLPMGGLEVETYAFVAAALIAPARLAYDGVLLQTLGRSLALAANPFRKAEQRHALPSELTSWVRLGPAILLGALLALFLHWSGL